MGRKFTDQGNEWHTMACTYTKIIFHVRAKTDHLVLVTLNMNKES